MNPEDVKTWDGGASMAPAVPNIGGAVVAVEQSRAVAETQAALIIAKQFPRSEIRAEKRILEACKRKSLAEVAEYAYPRGKAIVRGPSIRLAEVAARYWENLQFGLKELTQTMGGSEVEAYCHDLETNTRVSRVFQVKHIRRVGSSNKELDDPRDIYEMVANQGQRRVRACILEIIPGDVIEAAREQCQKTLQGGDAPLVDRIKAMVKAFEGKKISQAQIEARMGKRVEDLLEDELADLRAIYASIKDGMTKPEAWFSSPAETAKSVKPQPEPTPAGASGSPDQAPDNEAPAPPPEEKAISPKDRDRIIAEIMWEMLSAKETLKDGITLDLEVVKERAKEKTGFQRMQLSTVSAVWKMVQNQAAYRELRTARWDNALPVTGLKPETRTRLEAKIKDLGLTMEQVAAEAVSLDQLSEAGVKAFEESLEDMKPWPKEEPGGDDVPPVDAYEMEG